MNKTELTAKLVEYSDIETFGFEDLETSGTSGTSGIPDSETPGYLALCLRRQHNDAYKQWEVISIIPYQSNVKQLKFLVFHLSNNQGKIGLEKMKTHKLYVKYEELSQTTFGDWVTQEHNDEIKDLRNITTWWDYVDDSEVLENG